MATQQRLGIEITATDSTAAGITSAQRNLAALGAKAENIGRAMENIGARMAGVGAAGQAGLSRFGLDLGTLVEKTVESEKALYAIAVTAGQSGEAAAGSVKAWSAAINQIARETNQSQAKVTTAFSDMISKGLDTEAAVQMLKPIGRAATAAGAEIGDIASSAQAAFSQLKIPVSDVGQALDIMGKAGKAGAFELKDMSQFFDKLTASASNLGMTGKESLAGLAAAAQIARRGTGDAAQAATNLDNFLGKLNAQVTYKAFEKMDVDLGKLKESAKASGDYLGYMADAIKKITGGDSAKISALFSDVQAGAFVQKMVQDLDDYKKIQAEALTASGVAAKDFSTVMQSSAAQVDKMKINLEASSTEGGALDGIVKSLTALATWADDHPELAKWIIFGTAGLAVGGAAALGIGATITAIGGIATALGGLAAFLAANPVVLTILGLTAAFAAGYNFGTWLNYQIDLAVKAVTGNEFATLGTAIYDMVQWFADIPAKLSAQFEAWKTAGAALIQFLRTGIAEGLKGSLGIGDKLKEAVAYIGNMGTQWLKVGQDIMQGLLNGIQAKYKEIIAKIKGLGADMLDSVKDVLGIKSPSKEFEQVGLYIAEGMSLGISKGTLGVQRSIEDIAGAARASGYALEGYGDPLAGLAADLNEVTKAAEKTVPALKAVQAIQRKDNKGRFLPIDEAAATTEELRRKAVDLERTLTDALMRGFEGGKDAGKNFVDTIKNYMRTEFLKPIAVRISASIMGAIGMGSGTESEGGTAGGASDSFNMVSSLKSAYSAVTTGFQALGQSVGTTVSRAGSWLIENTTGTLEGFGNTLTTNAGTIGSVAASAAAAAAGMMANKLISNGYSISKGATTVQHIATAVASAINPALGVIVGTLSGVANRFFGRKLKDTGIEGTFGGTGFSGNSYEFYKGGVFRSDKTNRSAIDPQIDAALDMQFQAQRMANLMAGAALGGVNTALDSFTHSIKVSLKGLSEEDAQKAINEAFSGMNDAMAAQVLSASDPAWQQFARWGETASETLTRLSSSLATTNNNLEILGLTLFKTGLSGASAASALADTFGGLDAMQSSVGAYYESFYTDAEKLANTTNEVDKAFGLLGKSVPATKDEFRDLVKGLDLTSASGQAAFVTLMNIAPAFATMADAATEAADAAAEAAAKVAEAEKEKADKRRAEAYGLETQLLSLEENTLQLRARELDLLDPLNRGLQETVWQLEDAAKVTNERLGLERQLLELNENTAAIRAIDIKLIDETNRGLQEQVWALEDAKVAQQKYEDAVNDAQSAYDSAASTAQSANDAVDAIRQRATDQYISAQERVANATQAMADLQRDAANKLFGIGKTLRDFIAESSGAAAQTTFSQLLTKAMGGDQEAMEALPSAATGAMDEAEANARTRADMMIAQARILAQVSDVARLADKMGAKEAKGLPVELTAAQKAAQELKNANTELLSATKVVDAIFASKTQSPEDLIGEFNKADAEAKKAALDLATANQVLLDIKTNTQTTYQNVDSLKNKFSIELVLAATSTVKDYLTLELHQLSQEQINTALELMADVEYTAKYLLTKVEKTDITAATSLLEDITKNVEYAVKSIDGTQLTAVLSVLDDITKSVSFTVDTLVFSEDQKNTALSAISDINQVVRLTVGNIDSLSEDEQKTALANIASLSSAVKLTVNAIASDTVTDTNKTKWLKAIAGLSSSVTLTVTSLSQANYNTATEIFDTAKNIILKAVDFDAASQTIIANAMVALDRKVKLALASDSSTDALLAVKVESDTIYKTLSVSGATSLTDDQSNFLKAYAGTATLSGLSATVTWDADDGLRSIFTAISTASSDASLYAYGTGNTTANLLSAVKTLMPYIAGSYGKLTQIQQGKAGMEDVWFTSILDTVRSLKSYGYYSPTKEPLFSAKGNVFPFAEGGAFTNKLVNGATFFDLGVMGEAGPEAIMPLTRMSNGNLGVEAQMPALANYGRGDEANAALIAEIKALRGEVTSLRAETRAVVGNTSRSAKDLRDITDRGIVVRTEADQPLQIEPVVA